MDQGSCDEKNLLSGPPFSQVQNQGDRANRDPPSSYALRSCGTLDIALQETFSFLIFLLLFKAYMVVLSSF